MLLSATYVLVVAQSSSEVPEGLMNNPVLTFTEWEKLIDHGLLYKHRAVKLLNRS